MENMLDSGAILEKHICKFYVVEHSFTVGKAYCNEHEVRHVQHYTMLGTSYMN